MLPIFAAPPGTTGSGVVTGQVRLSPEVVNRVSRGARQLVRLLSAIGAPDSAGGGTNGGVPSPATLCSQQPENVRELIMAWASLAGNWSNSMAPGHQALSIELPTHAAVADTAAAAAEAFLRLAQPLAAFPASGFRSDDRHIEPPSLAALWAAPAESLTTAGVQLASRLLRFVANSPLSTLRQAVPALLGAAATAAKHV
jgi:hypothetical protein